MPNLTIEELSVILGVKLKAQDVNPQLLNNDRLNYQRNRIEFRVKYIVENYAEESGRTLPAIVAMRDDGTRWCLNGQHHSEAALRLNITAIPTYTFRSSGVDQEYHVFKRFQEWQQSHSEG